MGIALDPAQGTPEPTVRIDTFGTSGTDPIDTYADGINDRFVSTTRRTGWD
jgi:hypothetical protein